MVLYADSIAGGNNAFNFITSFITKSKNTKYKVIIYTNTQYMLFEAREFGILVKIEKFNTEQ